MGKRIMLFLSMSLLTPACSQAEPFVKAYAGIVSPLTSEAFSESLSGSGVGDLEFGSGLTAGLKLGSWLDRAPYLGYELDLNGHSADLEDLTVKSSSERIKTTGEHTVFSATLNLILRRPFGRVRPYIGAGAGFFYAELEDASFSPPFLGIAPELPDKNDEAFSWQLLGGVEFDIGSRLAFFAEYKYSRADLEFGETEFEIDYQANQFYGGITFMY